MVFLLNQIDISTRENAPRNGVIARRRFMATGRVAFTMNTDGSPRRVDHGGLASGLRIHRL
jgi:hypothetical protein